MHTFLQDIRFTLRQLRKSPGFALTTILTLALGIGATTGIFSLVDAVLLRPLPFPESDRLISLEHEYHNNGTVTPNSISYPDFFDWRAQNHSFSAIAAYRSTSFTLTGRGDARSLEGFKVSAEFFRVLGIHPALGRDFDYADEKPGQHIAMLSNDLWQSTFGSRPDIVGQTITLGGLSYLVAGVMPPGFSFPIQNPSPELWSTLADDAFDASGGTPMSQQRGADMLQVVGRLKPGVTLVQAHAEMNLIDSHLAAQYPDSNKRLSSARVTPQLENLVGDTRPALRLLFVAVSFLLLIACANVAGLLLARASRRRSEIALRSALGAARSQIIRQVLVESLVLSLLGGALGLAFSTLFLEAIHRFLPQNLPRLETIGVDAPVLLFTIAASVLTGLLFGVLPAWRMSRLDPSLALRDGTRSVTSGRGQHRLHSTLVIAETALGLMLLVAAGLFIRSFLRVLSVDPGFDKRNVLTGRIEYADSPTYANDIVHFYDQLLPQVAALPGVRSVAAGFPVPLSHSNIGVTFEVQGRPLPEGDLPIAGVNIITPNFFSTLRIPILSGRDFAATDTGQSQPVAIVNQAFAKEYFPGQDAVGKFIEPGLSDGVHPKGMHRIVAVVGDIRQRSLTAEASPAIYLPFTQCAVTSPLLVVRTSSDPVPLIPALRSRVSALNRNTPLYNVHTLEDLLSVAAAGPRFQVLLLTVFAGMALLLSAVGLYGVLAYMVAQRSNEMGLRLALGARRSDVLRLILRRGLVLSGIGLAVGLAVSAILTRYLSSLLYGVHAFDPLTYAGVSVLLIGIALLASAAPALQASRVDPIRTLRDQ